MLCLNEFKCLFQLIHSKRDFRISDMYTEDLGSILAVVKMAL
jgi:hypothetical protein